MKIPIYEYKREQLECTPNMNFNEFNKSHPIALQNKHNRNIWIHCYGCRRCCAAVVCCLGDLWDGVASVCVCVCASVIRDICLFDFYMFSKIQEQMDINKCDAHNTTAVFSNWIMEFVPQRERFSIFQFSGFGLFFGSLSMAGNLFIYHSVTGINIQETPYFNNATN